MRRGASIVVLLLSALVAAAAVAWACNPQAHVALDATLYEAGSTITVYGSYFPADATIIVSGAWGATITVRSSAGGGFTTQLTAPTEPGNYSISATRPTGGFAVASFALVEAQPKPPVAAPPPPPPPPAPTLMPAPALLGPRIVRSRPLAPMVRVTRSGAVELRCGRVEEYDVSGTCGAVSRAVTASGPLLTLRAKPFRTRRGRTIGVRFYLDSSRLRQVRAAGRMRMRGTIVARGALGNTSTSTFAFTLRLASRR